MPARTRLAQLIAKEEGFGLAGKIPTLRHNPGDLRHSPHSEHPGGPAHKEDIGCIDTDAHGWEDLERQLEIFAARGFTLRQMVEEYAPPKENNTGRYLEAVTTGLKLPPECLVSIALQLRAA